MSSTVFGPKNYLVIDNRNNGGGIEEFDLVSCRHCQRQLKISRNQREGNWCMKCHGPICERAECVHSHDLGLGSWYEQCEKVERRERHNALLIG